MNPVGIKQLNASLINIDWVTELTHPLSEIMLRVTKWVSAIALNSWINLELFIIVSLGMLL